MQDIRFYGTDIFRYYFYLIKNQFADTSWQITLSYLIVLLCILSIFIVCISFFRRHRRRKKIIKHNSKLTEQYGETIRDLMTDPIKSEIDVHEAFADEKPSHLKRNARHFIDMLIDIRNSIQTISYIPNIKPICEVCGITELIEHNLSNNIDVVKSLNNILMLQLRISEGNLANYVNAKNKDIRTLSRISYMICGTKDPYKYLTETLEENDSTYIHLLIHYTLLWLKTQAIMMPNLHTLIHNLENKKSSAFIVSELPCMIDDEQELVDMLTNLVTDDSEQIRLAAINVLKSINTNSLQQFLDKLIKRYDKETIRVQRTILNNILVCEYTDKSSISEFIKSVLSEASDNQTKDLCYRILYKYDMESFYSFHMSDTLSENDRMLTDVIESEGVLKNMRNILN